MNRHLTKEQILGNILVQNKIPIDNTLFIDHFVKLLNNGEIDQIIEYVNNFNQHLNEWHVDDLINKTNKLINLKFCVELRWINFLIHLYKERNDYPVPYLYYNSGYNLDEYINMSKYFLEKYDKLLNFMKNII